MNSFEIFSKLGRNDIVKNVFCYDVVGSTNDLAKEAAKENVKECLELNGEPCASLFVADAQTGGRGRRGRSWTSDEGTGIYMSLLMKPQIKSEAVSMLTLVAAIAVSRAITEVTGAKCNIKWPNDLLINDKKICGILTEAAFNNGQPEYVVIGIGINVNTQEFPEEIATTATSLKRELGRDIDRASIIAGFIHEFSSVYETFIQTEDLEKLSLEYNAGLINVGRQVNVLGNVNGEYNVSSNTEATIASGVAIGIDKSGALLIKKENGDIKRVVAGEVSVRGIYSYV